MTSMALTIEDVAPLLAAFGKRHATIRKLEVFGSVAAGDASTESDLDVLVTFSQTAPKGLDYFSFFVNLIEELQDIFKRKVDLVDRKALRNDVFGYNAVRNLKTVYERP